MERLAPRNILVFVPNWVGDAVMATPALAALKEHFPASKVTAVARPYVLPVLEGLDFIDEVMGLEGLKPGASVLGLFREARSLRPRRFDLAVLFTNSFRTALFALLAGAGRRVGYVREGRGLLLTEGIKPAKSGGRFEPRPMIDYYLDLVGSLGAPTGQRRMRLAVTPADSAAAEKVFADCRVDTSKPRAVLNPGAAFGSAKCWPAENFAAVADALAARGFEVLVVTGPKEKTIGEAIAAAAEVSLRPTWRANVPLGALKGIISEAAVLVTNDSGPRHFAAALDVPVVTLVGPTDPRWSETGFDREIVLRREVDCGPCMLRVCPRDHRCMTLITGEDVTKAVAEVLAMRNERG